MWPLYLSAQKKGRCIISHVVDIDVQIQDLVALKRACDRLGTLEFVEGQTRYRWYGRHVGDYPMPKGFTVADLGKCDHAIRVKDDHDGTCYEIGVVKRRDGKGYTFLFDFFNGGYGLYEAMTGEEWHRTGQKDPQRAFNKLYQEYTLEAAERSQEVQQYISEGWNVERVKQPDKSVHLVLTK